LRAELDNVDDIDQLPIEEKERTIPDEWVTGWRLNKLDSGLPIINMVGARAHGVEEDVYARRVDFDI
jgi:hypothetical protein